MAQRGVSEEEVQRVIELGLPVDAREPRLGRETVFTDGYSRRGRYYPHKRVNVIYVLERDDIVVVTVLAYYGVWEQRT